MGGQHDAAVGRGTWHFYSDVFGQNKSHCQDCCQWVGSMIPWAGAIERTSDTLDKAYNPQQGRSLGGASLILISLGLCKELCEKEGSDSILQIQTEALGSDEQ